MGLVTDPRPRNTSCRGVVCPESRTTVKRTPVGIARGDRRGDAETRRFRGKGGCREPRRTPRGRSRVSLGRGFARRAPARTRETRSPCATFPSRGPFRRRGQQRLTLAVARHGAHERAAVRHERHPKRVVETIERVYSCVGAPATDGVGRRDARTLFRRANSQISRAFIGSVQHRLSRFSVKTLVLAFENELDPFPQDVTADGMGKFNNVERFGRQSASLRVCT